MKETRRKYYQKTIFFDDEKYYILVRKNIKKIRKSKGLTQQQLADLTDISREYICDIENDSRKKHVSIGVLGRIATALDVPISEFFSKE